ncbi:hypothetical protein EBT16_06185, partial [bacterium]|nr:hypothetical protein [bacterium]
MDHSSFHFPLPPHALVRPSLLAVGPFHQGSGVVRKLGIPEDRIAFRDIEKAVSLYSSETRANVRVSSIRNTRMGW